MGSAAHMPALLLPITAQEGLVMLFKLLLKGILNNFRLGAF